MDGTLSGGEMKRLEIATVLAKPHKVSIFDEPEAGIDLWSFSMLIKRFEEIHKEKSGKPDTDFPSGADHPHGG
ncbi:MAG: ATP-binding cassette domain-containing protein [Clostridium sp.]